MTKIFAASMVHETHGFNKIPTEAEAFDIEIGDQIRENHDGTPGDSALSGLFDAARKYDWELVHPIAVAAMPSGPATKAAFEEFWATAEKALREDGPYDGVFFFMHGGQMTQHVDDPEGEFVKRARAIVGRDVPIAVMFDIHANVSPELIENVEILCGFHTTPHIDQRQTAERTTKLLADTISKKIKPVTWSVHPPVLIGIDHGRTLGDDCPVNVMLRRFEKLQASDPALLDISFFSGFPFCDTAATGASAVLVTNGADKRFADIVEAFGQEIWDTRDFSSIRSGTMKEAVAEARNTPGDGPFLIGDWTDTPHGGAYGDCVNALRALIEEGVSDAAFGAVFDPDVVKQAHAAGEGATIDVELGGKCAPERGGPLLAKAIVKSNSKTGEYTVKGGYNCGKTEWFGPSTCLSIEGIDVVVTPNPEALFDREQFRVFGVHPEEKDLIIAKAYNHFRADFEPISRGLAYADCGGIFTMDMSNFDFQKVRRPIHPLDADADFSVRTLRAVSKNGAGLN
ncbi:MAG: M81 family metallopeptidase [Pseudomonadota bacterium]